jgi:hypothetical protein
MHLILKIISLFIGLFIIANGVWLIATPPFGDEPLAYVVIVVGIIIPILVQYVAQIDDKREA